VLKDENAGSLGFGKLNNASTYPVSQILIGMADLPPEGGIVLLKGRDDASPGSIAGNTSKLFLPKAGYLATTSNEAGGQDRTFNGLDRTDR
jgi:hypothetical protein